MRGLNLLFSAGHDLGEQELARVWKAKELKSTCIPVLSLMLKDHKEPKERMLPTRPVCGASSSINGELSEYLSNIVDSINDFPETKEVISCEEMCGKLDDLNMKLIEEDVDMSEVMIASSDATALYPSLNIRDCARRVAKRLGNSKLEFQGVNYKWAVKYIALNLPRHEIVQKGLNKVVPIKNNGSQGADKRDRNLTKCQTNLQGVIRRKSCKKLVKTTFGHHY